MSQPIMIDTDIVSYFVRGGHPSVDARFTRTDRSRITVSAVTAAELMFGMKRLDPAKQTYRQLRSFLDMTAILSWDETAAAIYADIRFQLVSDGRSIGDLDTMIAAHAISLGAVLVTNNTRHFARIAPPLVLENWTLASE